MANAAIAMSIALTVGWASHYNPGIFERVVENRLSWGQVTHEQVVAAECFAAARYPKYIGETIYIKRVKYDSGLDNGWIPCLIVDVAGIADGGLEWMLSNNVIVEVDPDTMLRLRGGLGRGVRIVATFEKMTKSQKSHKFIMY